MSSILYPFTVLHLNSGRCATGQLWVPVSTLALVVKVYHFPRADLCWCKSNWKWWKKRVAAGSRCREKLTDLMSGWRDEFLGRRHDSVCPIVDSSQSESVGWSFSKSIWRSTPSFKTSPLNLNFPRPDLFPTFLCYQVWVSKQNQLRFDTPGLLYILQIRPFALTRSIISSPVSKPIEFQWRVPKKPLVSCRVEHPKQEFPSNDE